MIKLKKSISGYDHKKKSDIEACSIEIVEFTKLNGEMDAFMQKMDPSQNLVSQLAECIEGKFTNRQMAFMVSKITLVMMMAQAAKEDSNNEEE
jgi:hypothetical protein